MCVSSEWCGSARTQCMAVCVVFRLSGGRIRKGVKKGWDDGVVRGRRDGLCIAMYRLTGGVHGVVFVM